MDCQKTDMIKVSNIYLRVLNKNFQKINIKLFKKYFHELILLLLFHT